MKAKLLTLPEGIVALRTEDTIQRKEPMQDDKRYVVMQHQRSGRKVPYLFHPGGGSVLERKNLVSEIYEVLASTIEGVGKKLTVGFDRKQFGDNQSADNFQFLMLNNMNGKLFDCTETETELIIEL